MPEPDARLPPDSPGLHITLQRDVATHGWQADLQSDGMRQHFDSLAALIAWLARLEPASSVRGIR